MAGGGRWAGEIDGSFWMGNVVVDPSQAGEATG